MRSAKALLAALAAAAGCGDHTSTPAAFTVAPGNNVMPVSVNGAHCGGRSTQFLNQPCVSVTVCVPGTATCQTIDNVLLDTGSIGLRIFKQALTLSLPAVQAPDGGALAECVQFADMTADWGPVVGAAVVLANEPPVVIPIQVIDATFGTVPASCPSPETAPTSFNGVLGLGVFIADCGPTCPAQANIYFSSKGSSTTAVDVDVTQQLQNPVAALPVDNNGFIVSLPGVPAAGAPSVEGSLVIGLATRQNNVPTNASAIGLDAAGEFSTTVSGGSTLGGSFVDTGSNGLFFAPPSSIPACTDAKDWFCPPSTLSFAATNAPSPGRPGNHLPASFQIANFDALVVQPNNGNAVFSQVGGGAIAGAGFDWGLPFFFGRTVYIGIDSRSTQFGVGPLLAY
jgi:hypothetical protein